MIFYIYAKRSDDFEARRVHSSSPRTHAEAKKVHMPQNVTCVP